MQVLCIGIESCRYSQISNVQSIVANGLNALSNSEIIHKESTKLHLLINGTNDEIFYVYCNGTSNSQCKIDCQSSNACTMLYLICVGNCYVKCNEKGGISCPHIYYSSWKTTTSTADTTITTTTINTNNTKKDPSLTIDKIIAIIFFSFLLLGVLFAIIKRQEQLRMQKKRPIIGSLDQENDGLLKEKRMTSSDSLLGVNMNHDDDDNYGSNKDENDCNFGDNISLPAEKLGESTCSDSVTKDTNDNDSMYSSIEQMFGNYHQTHSPFEKTPNASTRLNRATTNTKNTSS